MAQKTEAVGSVWNPNSWHWESKNCNQKVQGLIESKILSIELSTPTCKVVHTKATPKGEGEVNIRKGKQMIIFDYEVEVEFRGSNSENEVEGSYKIVDINQTDLDFEVINIKIQKTDYNILAHETKELIRKQVRKQLEDKFRSLVQEIQQFEGDHETVQQKKKEKEEKNQQIKVLQEQSKEVMDQMLQEQKEKEYQMRLKNNMPN